MCSHTRSPSRRCSAKRCTTTSRSGTSTSAPARAAAHGVAVEGVADGPVLLVDADGPVAVAEPREGGLLKPTVGFRAG